MSVWPRPTVKRQLRQRRCAAGLVIALIGINALHGEWARNNDARRSLNIIKTARGFDIGPFNLFMLHQ